MDENSILKKKVVKKAKNNEKIWLFEVTNFNFLKATWPNRPKLFWKVRLAPKCSHKIFWVKRKKFGQKIEKIYPHLPENRHFQGAVNLILVILSRSVLTWSEFFVFFLGNRRANLRNRFQEVLFFWHTWYLLETKYLEMEVDPNLKNSLKYFFIWLTWINSSESNWYEAKEPKVTSAWI